MLTLSLYLLHLLALTTAYQSLGRPNPSVFHHAVPTSRSVLNYQPRLPFHKRASNTSSSLYGFIPSYHGAFALQPGLLFEVSSITCVDCPSTSTSLVSNGSTISASGSCTPLSYAGVFATDTGSSSTTSNSICFENGYSGAFGPTTMAANQSLPCCSSTSNPCGGSSTSSYTGVFRSSTSMGSMVGNGSSGSMTGSASPASSPSLSAASLTSAVSAPSSSYRGVSANGTSGSGSGSGGPGGSASSTSGVSGHGNGGGSSVSGNGTGIHSGSTSGGGGGGNSSHGTEITYTTTDSTGSSVTTSTFIEPAPPGTEITYTTTDSLGSTITTSFFSGSTIPTPSGLIPIASGSFNGTLGSGSGPDFPSISSASGLSSVPYNSSASGYLGPFSGSTNTKSTATVTILQNQCTPSNPPFSTLAGNVTLHFASNST
ncbi:hypothetical protein MMC18_009647, partial [Xylographa bjoerkii]|nr:hypothetical protein [Xylographa bjoerkii]